MVKKKHSFIDKKNAQKFSLVHRSQRDPLVADDEASQHVLVSHDGTAGISTQPDDDTESVAEYGVDYDDGYDYMQHLKQRGVGELILADDPMGASSSHYHDDNADDDGLSGEKMSFGKLLLPAEALPSVYEEDEGMLSKGLLPHGPQPDWDPDIVEALDDGIDLDDPDNILEDDFMMMANDVKPPRKNEEGWVTASDDGDDGSDDGDGSEFSGVDSDFDDLASNFSEEETKTRFTNYSMTSSVIRRTAELKVLDDRFEKVMEEYDDEEIGCVDDEELIGAVSTNASDLVSQALGEFEASQQRTKLTEVVIEESDGEMEAENECDDDKDESEDEEELFSQFKKTEKPEWDCESVISTYSNLYNHPKIIANERKPSKAIIEVGSKTGLPLGVLQKRKPTGAETERKVADGDDSRLVVLNNVRDRAETKEAKRERKLQVREQRKERRGEKKANKQAFKGEELKQGKLEEIRTTQQAMKL